MFAVTSGYPTFIVTEATAVLVLELGLKESRTIVLSHLRVAVAAAEKSVVVCFTTATHVSASAAVLVPVTDEVLAYTRTIEGGSDADEFNEGDEAEVPTIDAEYHKSGTIIAFAATAPPAPFSLIEHD